jgi:hypothetical protein
MVRFGGGLTEIVKVEKKRVLEPTEVLGREGTYGGVIRAGFPRFRDWHPSPEMRQKGYTANPDICRHVRRGYAPREGWWCMDCGDRLKEERIDYRF